MTVDPAGKVPAGGRVTLEIFHGKVIGALIPVFAEKGTTIIPAAAAGVKRGMGGAYENIGGRR